MSKDSFDLRTSGTVFKQAGEMYLFKNDSSALPIGQKTSPAAAMTWLEDKLARKLTRFEVGLMLSTDGGGKMQIMLVSAVEIDPSQRNPLLAASYQPIGYIIMIRANSRRVNYGDIIQTERFYDKDGNLYGQLSRSRKQESPLEKPFLDPIDFVAGALASIVRGAVKKIIRSGVAAIEERLISRGANSELAKLASLTEAELSAIRGGSSGLKPPLMSADALNKPVPQIKEGMGAKLMLNAPERDGARQIIGVLERVRNGDSWAWAELIPNRRIQQLKFDKWAKQGWTEIDLLTGNPGWANRIRMLVRVGKGDIEYKLMQVH